MRQSCSKHVHAGCRAVSGKIDIRSRYDTTSRDDETREARGSLSRQEAIAADVPIGAPVHPSLTSYLTPLTLTAKDASILPVLYCIRGDGGGVTEVFFLFPATLQTTQDSVRTTRRGKDDCVQRRRKIRRRYSWYLRFNTSPWRLPRRCDERVAVKRLRRSTDRALIVVQ